MTSGNVPQDAIDAAWYSRHEVSEVPGLDCLRPGHMLVTLEQPGAFPTEAGAAPWASWCLWCGGGVSNELIEEHQ